MTSDTIHPFRRRSIRLKGYDYRQAGAYFVTICAHNRSCLFGRVVDGTMQPNEAGEMLYRVWEELPGRFPHLEVDSFIVMPNHVHGVVVFDDITDPGRSLGSVIRAFKSLTTGEYIQGVRSHGWRPFSHKLWQRNYFEHVIRSEQALELVHVYIENNGAKWTEDPENPDRVP